MKYFRQDMRHALRTVLVVAMLLLGDPQCARENAEGAVRDASSERLLARDLLRQLVQIDTTPPNGCTKASEMLAARLRSAGFSESDVLLLGSRPDRQNLVIRLRGCGQAKPILLIAHLDVVAAPREGWAEGLEPFQLTERDGFYYGRGVLDVKWAAASLIAVLTQLRAEGFVPERDILIALTADEETGNANGVAWLLSNRPDLMDVAYCLNLDAGGGHMEKGKPARMTVQTSEKSYLSFRIETQSPGGHSSLPEKDNAIYRLAEGLARLAKLEFSFRFNETTQGYFEGLAKVETGSLADDMRAVAKDPPDLDAAGRLAAASPYYNAILRTTCVATRVEGGHADNALPQSAQAIVNCRVFPGDSLEFVRDAITGALADPQIRVTALGMGQPIPASPLLPEVMEPVRKLSNEMWPGVPVLPVMDPWASDSTQLRRAGIPTYGVSGTFGELDLGNAHGVNERLPIESFDKGIEFLDRLLKRLAAARTK
jgi:acetylornithine deacetylase/succinyl-diaminopimelate desuccinylase-like protein